MRILSRFLRRVGNVGGEVNSKLYSISLKALVHIISKTKMMVPESTHGIGNTDFRNGSTS